MKSRQLYLALCLGLLMTASAKAQFTLVNVDYSFGMTTGDFEKFISDPAFRGGHLGFTKFLNSNEQIGIGFSIDWQGFYQKMPRSTFAYYEANGSTNTDINAVQLRYLYTTPVKLSLNYFFLKEGPILPFIGINAGMQYTKQELNISAIENRLNNSWDFAYGAEIGIYAPFGESGFGANLIGKYNGSTYNYTFENIGFKTANASYYSVALGLTMVFFD